VYYVCREIALKGDKMAKKDSFNKAKAEVVSAGKTAHFNNAMKKCNLAAEFAKRGIDIKTME